MSKLTLTTTCPSCSKKHQVEVEKEDFVKYQRGLPIHKAFPYLNKDDREALITGLCYKCWEEMMLDAAGIVNVADTY